MDPVMHDAEEEGDGSRALRIEGQVRAVRRMIEEDRTCENIAQQSQRAARSTERSHEMSKSA
jgi:DNA-binding FrmR family transcriptional regulator